MAQISVLFFFSNRRHKAKLARAWPKLLLTSLAVDHSLFMGLFLNNWKIRDLFNPSSSVYRSMIHPKSILTGLQDNFLFPVYLNISFHIFSCRHLKRPWCICFPSSCNSKKVVVFFSHQTNKFLWHLKTGFSFWFLFVCLFDFVLVGVVVLFICLFLF